MSTAPNCSKNTQRARLRRARYIEHDKNEEKWVKELGSSKYPRCIGKGFFDDCPKEVPDIKNPPSSCRSCPEFVPPMDEIRNRMKALMEEMNKKQ